MANTRVDRLPLTLVHTFRAPFFHQESRSLVDGESSLSPRPPSLRSSRRSPKKGRLDLGAGNLGKTTEEEQQDLDSSENINPGVGLTLVPTAADIATVEEDSGDEHKMVISVSGSPPHETKMRQISEGVHGIEMKRTSTGDDDRLVTLTPFPTTGDASVEDKSANSEEPPIILTGPVVIDEPTTSAAEPSAVPDDSLPSLDRKKRTSVGSLHPFPGSRRGSDSSAEQEKGLKRKLGDRAVSESREAECVGKKASKKDAADAATTCATGVKRTRDEEDKDPNPKEAKRPSPPPEKTSKAAAEEPPVASSSKLVGIHISDSGKPVA